MTHELGSAVEIFCEIPTDKITGTTLTLEELKDPDGTDYAESQSLTFSEVEGKTNIASVVWQSSVNTHIAGKYTFLIKSLNGTRENYGRGSFYLTEG